MTDPGEILQSACDAVLLDPTLRPVYDPTGKLLITHCNQATRIVAHVCGCTELDDLNLNAEDMIGIIQANASGRWKVGVTGPVAALHALDGGFGVAFMTREVIHDAHAHITAIYPEATKFSGSLTHDVPMVANVGKGDPRAELIDLPNGQRTKANWKCRSSEAFPPAHGEAVYAIWA